MLFGFYAVKILMNKEYREGLRKQNGQLNIGSIYKKVKKRGVLIGTGTVVAFFLIPVLGLSLPLLGVSVKINKNNKF